MDGFGLSKDTRHNAIFEAKTPNLDELFKTCPFVEGQASGLFVGLPDGQMGNSEVGHLNMGAGRVVYQDLTRITKSIQDGDFFENPALLAAVENCKKNDSTLHIWGLISPGGVHSHTDHLYALLELAKRHGLTKVFVHCFLDGRDTPPAAAKEYVATLEEKMAEIGVGQVASVSGRYYAMDRDNRWERVQLAYDNLTKANGKTADSATGGIQASYDDGKTDEFVIPFSVVKDGKPLTTVKENDSIIFSYVCFTDYDKTIPNKLIAFGKESYNNIFGQFLADHGMTQLRIAETEKYAHVTFFFNGGVEVPYKGEDRILVPSPKVPTYDMQPEMSAYEVCDKLCEAIRSGKYDAIIINYANCDMVGHTGIEPAVIKAVEAVDTCVGRTVQAVKDVNGVMFLCADHGNAEKLWDYETDAPFTAHTTNPVPFVLINADPKYKLKEGGRLCDICPTLIELMGMEQPKEMTGVSLLTE